MKLNYELSEIYNSINNELNCKLKSIKTINKNTSIFEINIKKEIEISNDINKLKMNLSKLYKQKEKRINLDKKIITSLNNLTPYLTKEEHEELNFYLTKTLSNSSDKLLKEIKENQSKINTYLNKLDLSNEFVYYVGASGCKLYKIDTFNNTFENFINVLLEKVCLKNNNLNLINQTKKLPDKTFNYLLQEIINYFNSNKLTDPSELINYLETLSYEEKIQKIYLKRPKIKLNTYDYIEDYKKLTYDLHKLRMTNKESLEEISILEFKLLELSKKYNIGNIEKIDANIYAIEKYHEELTSKDQLINSKNRGISIYEDLNYKLFKQKAKFPINLEKIKKLEEKIKECLTKYNLEEIDKIDAQIRVIKKYSEKLEKKDEDKKVGLNTYEHLISDLYNLKKDELKNRNKIDDITNQIKKCSTKYNLSNLDKLNIQFKILEQIN